MTNNNSPFRVYIAENWEKEKLKKWLNLWNLKKEIDTTFKENSFEPYNVINSEDSVFKEKIKEIVRDFDKFPKEGEIRLLSPEFDLEISLPKYIAVLRKWPENTFLVSPFSPISIAAVQGEFETGKKHFSLANMELWNSTIAPLQVLERSWLADELTQEQTNDAFLVFKFIATGIDLPERLKKRIGPPIFAEDDPRNEYQNEEEIKYLLFKEACEKAMETESALFNLYQTVKTKIRIFIGENLSTEYCPMAAGQANKADFSIPVKDSDFEIVVEWDEYEEVTKFWIKGEKASEICAKNNKLVVVFENGETVVHKFDNNKNIFLKIPKKNYPIAEIKFSLE
ncbi:MAG: hypothetical protein RBT87_03850 [bacterium]|jgi:hypothetical protein|nr:hypothetical protein [bacterium]